MKERGKIHRFGDHIDTDIIIPARYLNTPDMGELAKHCMEPLEPDFPNQVAQGDMICAGENFGCGSSREHAPAAIKACGVSCVIAASFARIFYRNAINIGLPILECPEASRKIEAGDTVSVDFESGEIRNETKGETYQAEPFPPFIQKIIEAGGLMNSIKKEAE